MQKDQNMDMVRMKTDPTKPQGKERQINKRMKWQERRLDKRRDYERGRLK